MAACDRRYCAVEQGGCADRDENCAAWSESGECARNPEYMEANCAASCGTC